MGNARSQPLVEKLSHCFWACQSASAAAAGAVQVLVERPGRPFCGAQRRDDEARVLLSVMYSALPTTRRSPPCQHAVRHTDPEFTEQGEIVIKKDEQPEQARE